MWRWHKRLRAVNQTCGEHAQVDTHTQHNTRKSWVCIRFLVSCCDAFVWCGWIRLRSRRRWFGKCFRGTAALGARRRHRNSKKSTYILYTNTQKSNVFEIFMRWRFVLSTYPWARRREAIMRHYMRLVCVCVSNALVPFSGLNEWADYVGAWDKMHRMRFVPGCRWVGKYGVKFKKAWAF